MKPVIAPGLICGILLAIVECCCFTDLRAEDKFTHFPWLNIMVSIINNMKIKSRQGLAHRTYLASCIHQETRRVDHAKPLDKAQLKTLLQGTPGISRTASRENHADGIIPVVWPLLLFKQDGDHRAKGVELHCVVLPAIVPVL